MCEEEIYQIDNNLKGYEDDDIIGIDNDDIDDPNYDNIHCDDWLRD